MCLNVQRNFIACSPQLILHEDQSAVLLGRQLTLLYVPVVGMYALKQLCCLNTFLIKVLYFMNFQFYLFNI